MYKTDIQRYKQLEAQVGSSTNTTEIKFNNVNWSDIILHQNAFRVKR